MTNVPATRRTVYLRSGRTQSGAPVGAGARAHRHERRERRLSRSGHRLVDGRGSAEPRPAADHTAARAGEASEPRAPRAVSTSTEAASRPEGETSRGPKIAVFAPHPLLTVTIEMEGPERQRIHFHAGGQGPWVARMAAHMGAAPVLCAFIGGESGRLLPDLLQQAIAPGELRLVKTSTASGSYVTDRRSGERELVAMMLSDPPTRHELDELFSLTCAEAISCGWLIVTNPMPGSSLPLELYGDLVADAKANGVRTLVDLSSPRMDSALRGQPELAKLNDWELAGLVEGPVSEPAQLLAAARRLQEMGAQRVIVSRGEKPALVLDGERPLMLSGPPLEHGYREGCGDAMMGAVAATLVQGESFERALAVGAAAGAANFLRRGLGSASREVVERLLGSVRLEPWPEQGDSGRGR